MRISSFACFLHLCAEHMCNPCGNQLIRQSSRSSKFGCPKRQSVFESTTSTRNVNEISSHLHSGIKYVPNVHYAICDVRAYVNEFLLRKSRIHVTFVYYLVSEMLFVSHHRRHRRHQKPIQTHTHIHTKSVWSNFICGWCELWELVRYVYVHAHNTNDNRQKNTD